MTQDTNPQVNEDVTEESILSRVGTATSRQFKSEEELVQWATNANKAIGANEHSKLAQEAKDFKEQTGKSPSEYLTHQSEADTQAEITQATDTGSGVPASVTTNVGDMPIADLERDFESVIASFNK